jgi:hypothetical protein
MWARYRIGDVRGYHRETQEMRCLARPAAIRPSKPKPDDIGYSTATQKVRSTPPSLSEKNGMGVLRVHVFLDPQHFPVAYFKQ